MAHENSRTVIAQNSVEIRTRKVKFPQTMRHHKARATIYGKTVAYPHYRLSYQVAGKRKLKTFSTYGEAKAEAERVVRELTSGSQATALSASQARDSIAAFQCLEAYQKATGRKLTLLGALSEYVEAAGKLEGQSLCQVVTRYMAAVATVRRKASRRAGLHLSRPSFHKPPRLDANRIAAEHERDGALRRTWTGRQKRPFLPRHVALAKVPSGAM